MNRALSIQIWNGVAGVVLAAGVVLVAYTLSALPNELRKLERKTADLTALKQLAAADRTSRRALAPFEALANKTPPALAGLAAQTLAGITPAIRQRESQAAANGWQARRAEVKCDASPATLGAFLAAAEAVRPPWRLVEFDFVSGVTAPDTVRATLLLEALENK